MSADNHNLGIWNAVAKTDPSHTKAVTFGRKFTSIDAHWQIMRATEQFGPVGQGWGYNVDHSVERLTPEMILAVADVAIWWRDGDDKQMYGPVRGTCEMYGPKTSQGKPIPGVFITDEDAPKKAMTDALTKGLSHLGFSADVFLGLFDDNRYVQKIKKEFEQTSVPMGSPPGDFADEARRDGLTTETRSTYQINAAANAAKWTDTAIATLAMAMTAEHVDAWREDNAKALERLEKNHPAEYARVDKAADERRGDLTQAAA